MIGRGGEEILGGDVVLLFFVLLQHFTWYLMSWCLGDNVFKVSVFCSFSFSLCVFFSLVLYLFFLWGSRMIGGVERGILGGGGLLRVIFTIPILFLHWVAMGVCINVVD